MALAAAMFAGHAHNGEYFFSLWTVHGGAASLARSWMFRIAALVPAASAAWVILRRIGDGHPSTAGRALGMACRAAPCALLCASCLLAARALLRHVHCGTIYTDDHASFLFRLCEFWGAFPWRENFVPHWNAGVVNSVLTSSGVPGYAIFTAPLHFLLGEPHRYHTLGMALYHAVFAPWLAVWGFRACRRDWTTSLIGGLLVLCASRSFFTWTLHFGTVGAAVSWAAAPSAMLFAYAVAGQGHSDWRTACGLAVSFLLLCSWPQMWVFAAMVGLAAAMSLPRLWSNSERRAIVVLFAVGVAVLLVQAHSLLAVAKAKDLVEFTTRHAQGNGATLVAAWSAFKAAIGRSLMVHGNPLCIVFGIAGAAAVAEKPLRRWIAVIFAGCAAVLSAGQVKFPNMQFYRMEIPLVLAAAVPAAIMLGRLFRSGGAASLPLRAAAALLLLLGAANTVRIYRGGGFETFEGLDPVVSDMADWIGRNVPEGSRVAFAGQAVHSYGHGHIAYLPVLSGREMMSCDYYGFPVGTYEPDFPPSGARAVAGGIEDYLRTHSASHVVTCRANYRKYFDARPESYERVSGFTYRHWTGTSDIGIYRVLGEVPPTLRGASGAVAATFNRIGVEFEGEPPDRAVLAYHWNSRMTVEPPAEIAPAPDEGTLSDEAPFIELRPHGARKVEIRYNPRL